MRNIIILGLTILISACTGNPFGATPAPDEVVTMDYTIQSQSGLKSWNLINDNLKVTVSSRSNSGQVISNKVITSTYEQFEVMITNLEKSKFTQAKSSPASRQTQARETMIIKTHAKTYTYTQNATTQFPKGVQQAVNYITGTFK